MPKILKIDDFLNTPGPLYDVRSPGEYNHGFIPSALNLPLFSDEERAAVGTAYKKISPQEAFLLGLQYVGPKMRSFAEVALKNSIENARIYCWRGGLRSRSMGWLFKTSGLQPCTLSGGYKAFRHWVLEKFQQPLHLFIVGGFTGSGKTVILNKLKACGEQVIDLEALAHHRGSAFGFLGMPSQPTTEQFENSLATALHNLNPHKPIWMEDESRMIGTCKIPDRLFQTMRTSPLIIIQRPLDERVELLLEQYGAFSQNQLVDATRKLARRLGGTRTIEIQQRIISGNLRSAASLLLEYYDGSYLFSTKKSGRQPIILNEENLSAEEWALKIKECYAAHQ